MKNKRKTEYAKGKESICIKKKNVNVLLDMSKKGNKRGKRKGIDGKALKKKRY